MHPQLMLPLGIAPTSSFESYFVCPANSLAVQTVMAFAANELEDSQLYLWGRASAGKSHLLSAACQMVAGDGYRVAYLTGELASMGDALDGIESSDLVCIDDVHTVSESAELALFGCINRCREQGTRMLFAADAAVDELDLALPDLRTRLSWGPVFHLQPLDDAEVRQALQHLAGVRGFALNDEVVDYLLRHFPRDIRSSVAVLDKLDAASMSEQRRITVPLVRSVMKDQESLEPDAENRA